MGVYFRDVKFFGCKLSREASLCIFQAEKKTTVLLSLFDKFPTTHLFRAIFLAKDCKRVRSILGIDCCSAFLLHRLQKRMHERTDTEEQEESLFIAFSKQHHLFYACFASYVSSKLETREKVEVNNQFLI